MLRKAFLECTLEKAGVILYHYLPITTTSLQVTLSSVPKVAIVDRLYCNYSQVSQVIRHDE